MAAQEEDRIKAPIYVDNQSPKDMVSGYKGVAASSLQPKIWLNKILPISDLVAEYVAIWLDGWPQNQRARFQGVRCGPSPTET
jgi:hypothetical protein